MTGHGPCILGSMPHPIATALQSLEGIEAKLRGGYALQSRDRISEVLESSA